MTTIEQLVQRIQIARQALVNISALTGDPSLQRMKAHKLASDALANVANVGCKKKSRQ
jgi:hypothetical protein